MIAETPADPAESLHGELDRLEAALAAPITDAGQRAEIAARLHAVVAQWDGSQPAQTPGPADDVLAFTTATVCQSFC